MHKRVGFLLSLFFVVIALVGCTAQNEQNSNGNNEEKKTEEPEYRIISTTVVLTEIANKLDLDLVGIPTTSKELPERYKNLPEVGMAMSPNMEMILSLKPTDVLTATTLTEYVEEPFTQYNVPATYFNLESVDNMYEEILKLGEKYNRTEQAGKLVNDFENRLKEIEEKVKGQEGPTVLILLGVPGSYLVATEDSYVGDLVRRLGGKNAVSNKGVEYISSNTENLQQSNPDIILRLAHGLPDEVIKMFDKEFKENDIWKHFKAVQNNRVYDLEEERYGTTASLEAPEALEELLGILYPDLK